MNLCQPVDFLCLTRQPESVEEVPQSSYEIHVDEVHLIHVRVHDFLAEIIVFPKKIAYVRLVESIFVVKETGDFILSMPQ